MGCRNSRIKFKGYAYVMQDQGTVITAPPETKITTTNVDMTPNGNNLLIANQNTVLPTVELAALKNQFNSLPVPPPAVELTQLSLGMFHPPRAGFLDNFPNFETDLQLSLAQSFMKPMDTLYPKFNESLVPTPLAMPIFPPIGEPLVPQAFSMLAMPTQKPILAPLLTPLNQKPHTMPIKPLPHIQSIQPIQQMTSIPQMQIQLTSHIPRPISSQSNNSIQFPAIPTVQNNIEQLFSSSNRFNIQNSPFLNTSQSPTQFLKSNISKTFLKTINAQ